MVTRFRETIPMVKSVRHSRSRKNSDFDRNYHFTIFQKIIIFFGFTRYLTSGASKDVKFQLSRNSTKFDMVAKFCKTIPTVKSVLSSEI